MPGTNTWAEQLPNGSNYSFLVNTRQYVYGSNPNAFENLQGLIERRLDPGLTQRQTHHFVEVDARRMRP